MERFVLDQASEKYRKQREALRQAEIALKDQVKKVAAMRAALPADTPVEQDYVFTEAESGRTRNLPDLFEDPGLPLIVFHYMWSEEMESPCPMCSMWADGYDGVVPHLRQRANVVLAAKRSADELAGWAKEKGWRSLPIVSTAGTTFNADFGMEDSDGNQLPGVSVFLRGEDGGVRHFYTVSAIMGGDNYNGMDLFSPVWNLFDLLPEGRGSWMPSLRY